MHVDDARDTLTVATEEPVGLLASSCVKDIALRLLTCMAVLSALFRPLCQLHVAFERLSKQKPFCPLMKDLVAGRECHEFVLEDHLAFHFKSPLLERGSV